MTKGKNSIDDKKESSYEETSKLIPILKIVFNFVFWIGIIGLAIIWITEFILVKVDQDPLFCIDRNNYQFEDGTTTECVGLGYKVYEYDRDSITAREFGPFFIEMRD